MAVPSGALRFNSDSRKLEYYNGEAWWQIDSFTPDSATGGARGVFGGGTTPTVVNTIDYITISTTGNSLSFGNLATQRQDVASLSSTTRGVFAGGRNPTILSLIEYVTIASTGNTQDFGDITSARRDLAGLSDSHGGLG